ncbi:unnamed protein product [Danaus chrysippus]|uniref:(African queen) hypothetical protein n=1 Tax=Danaus chrysippus TaxID=151541 RepID=A0A8J2QUY2_9NEOP|nr:unnamed protein product [Danaus chrysippus]
MKAILILKWLRVQRRPAGRGRSVGGERRATASDVGDARAVPRPHTPSQPRTLYRTLCRCTLYTLCRSCTSNDTLVNTTSIQTEAVK